MVQNDRATRSGRVTNSTSPAPSWASASRSCARSLFVPLAPRGTPSCAHVDTAAVQFRIIRAILLPAGLGR